MRRLMTAFIIPALVLALTGLASAETPKEKVQGIIDRAFSILKDTEKSDGWKRAEFRNLILASLDHEKIMRRLLGRELLDKSTEDQRQEFLALSLEILQRTQINILTLSKDVAVTVIKERVDNDLSVVSANIKTRENNISVDFKLRLVNGEWKVYDYSVEGISYMQVKAAEYRGRLHKVRDFEMLLQALRNLIGSWENKPLSVPQGG